VRRILRAGQKEGAKSGTFAPDGSIIFTLAEPSQREVSLREVDDIIESERAKWGAKDDKTTP
jgi:hypothetical protein